MVNELKGLIKRYFTVELENAPEKSVYDLFEYKLIDINMVDYKTGKTIFDMKDAEFPVGFSKNACTIIATKYFRKAGVSEDCEHETSIKQVVDRMVGFWVDSLLDEGMISAGEEWQILYDELAYALLSQIWAPNSPQWFNTGIKRSYGICGDDDELFYYDPDKKQVVRSKDRYTRTQASACFIVSIRDSLIGPHSISEQYTTETKLFKGGSGVGTNFSVLRGLGEKLSNGGVSSGMMSFLKGFDRNAGAIKSGGTTRRAAKMVIVDVDHPEIEEFITWKAREEDKVRALGKMGYDTSMDGEAYQSVSGQNGNNSVRLSGEFMKKVLSLQSDPDSSIRLKGRVDDGVERDVFVRDLWASIVDCAWQCADPALQFDDIFNFWHTCPAGEDGNYGAKHNRINATNPCSEYAFLDDTACNLASINIYKFFDDATGKIDIKGYMHIVAMIQLVLEASIHWGQFPTEDIARKSHMFRTTGIGLANIASLIMVMGHGYDSDEARNIVSALCSIMTGYSYYVSSLMAKKLGAFEKYELNKSYLLGVLESHAACSGAVKTELKALNYKPFTLDPAIFEDLDLVYLYDACRSVWTTTLASAKENGVRNAQVSVIAPTGTIALAMDCGATSCEPFYSHVVYKKLVGGGSMEIVNPILEKSLANLGYTADEIAQVNEYLLQKDKMGMFVNYTLEDAPIIRPEHKKIFETANEISPEGHVLMVSAITPMISGSVSKTVNLPANATREDVDKIYKLAYLTGTKAISIYRDGSKACQPLNTGKQQEKQDVFEEYTYQQLVDFALRCRDKVPERIRPSGVRMSRTHSAKIDDIELYVTIGFYPNGKMSEIFVSTDKEGTVVKGLLAALSKALSNMLQYNIPPKELSRLLKNQQFEPSGFVGRHPYIKNASSIADLISKIIDIELGDYTRCQVKPAEEFKGMPSLQNPEAVVSSASALASQAPQQSYGESDASDAQRVYGETCPNCSSDRLVKNGTCKVCLECGTTTGCS